MIYLIYFFSWFIIGFLNLIVMGKINKIWTKKYNGKEFDDADVVSFFILGPIGFVFLCISSIQFISPVLIKFYNKFK